MNDRFKFRHFEPYEKKIYNVLAIDFETGDIEIDNGTDNEGKSILKLVPKHLLQCTGLKDKNGKLIYEGDIVRFYDDTICIIKWDNESGMFCTLDTEGQAMIGVPKYYEVLGNIYENPELAKEIKATWKSKEEKNNG